MNQETNKHEEMEQRLREAAKSSLSKEESRAQSISFALGMKSEEGGMTKEQLEKLVEERY
ncbi:MAG: hypothetical protein OXD01_05450 [Gammaproteobacteria bacterium]|nr:hypothetical protein [Gammaproteobacteria bacterium]